MRNSIPKLLDTLRPSLNDVAEWVKVSRGLVQTVGVGPVPAEAR